MGSVCVCVCHVRACVCLGGGGGGTKLIPLHTNARYS